MQKVRNYASLVEVTSSDLNTIQDNALGIAQAAGLFVGPRPYLRADGSGNVYVGPVPSVALTTPVNALRGNGAELTITPAGLVNGTWYYVYIYDTGTAIGAEYSTTGPDIGLQFKTGDTSRVYVGCFTQNLGSIVPFRMRAGNYVFRYGLSAVNVPNILASGTSTTLFTFSAGLPSHVRLAKVLVSFFNYDTTAGRSAYIGVGGDGFDGMPIRAAAAQSSSLPGVSEREVDVEVSGGGLLQYRIGTATTPNSTLSVDLVGFLER